MSHVTTIAKRQFLSYFNGPVAYIVSVVVLGSVGFLFMFWPPGFFLAGRATADQMFFWFGVMMVLAAPAMTMGLVAEERGSGTIELLLTMPVREWEIIVGKFLGSFALFAAVVGLTLPIPMLVASLGDLDWGPVLTGYVGIILQGAAMIALGLMTSSWTKDQLVAFFVSLFVLAMIGWIIPLALQWASSGAFATVLEYISLQSHLQSMSRGIVDSRDLLYYLSLTAFGLLAAFRALESRRWS